MTNPFCLVTHSTNIRQCNAFGLMALIAITQLVLGSPAALAQIFSEQTLSSFAGSTTDGEEPLAGLAGVDGLLYGTTHNGGASDQGTIFSINPTTKAEKTLFSFGGSKTKGRFPAASLIDVNGTLYGTTSEGGLGGMGTVFSFDPVTMTVTNLLSFSGSNGDGNSPFAGLIDVKGTLYGTTLRGGDTNGDGTLFSIDLATKATAIVYRFGSNGDTDGTLPHSDLIEVNGILYGTTAGGGSLKDGTVFSFDPTTQVEHILHSFTGQTANNDGAGPESALIEINGTLYGTTRQGGTGNTGTMFSFDRITLVEKTLYSFTATDTHGRNSDGAESFASLIAVNGTLYGTASFGGTSGNGTIFSLTPIVPTAKNDAARGIANHTIIVAAPGVIGNDITGEDPNVTAALDTNPTHGTITFNSDGSFTYKPNANFVGTDSFTYKDTNLAGTSNTATCTIAIGPIAYNDAGRTYFNTPVTINTPGVLGNDVTGGIATTASLVTNPSRGTITFNSNGGFTYTPTSGFLGTDSFTYKITSAGGTSAPATCSLSVQARTPVANNDAGRVTHNTTLTITAPGVLGNDNPGTTGAVTAAIVTNPTHGTITFHTDGSFIYKPTTGFIGTDSFTYKDTNAIGTSNIATCTLTVQ